MDLHKIAVKFFAENPGAVALDAFIPVFHRWIQKHSVEGMLLDVADYAHVPQGPGVALIGHDADYFLDSMEGPLGLLYSRKRPGTGSLKDRVAAAVAAARAACSKLEAEPEFGGKLRFRAGEALFIANDRLAAPATEETFRALRPDLEAAFSAAFGSKVELARDGSDLRNRLTVRVKAAKA